MTAAKAEDYVNARLSSLDETAMLLKSTGNIRENVEKLISENSSLRKTIEKFQALTAVAARKELENSAIIVGDIKLITGIIEAD